MRYKELVITIILFLVILSTHAFAQTIKVMPLGDSITRGFASTNINGYRGDLLGLLTTEGITIDFVGSLSDGVGFADTDHAPGTRPDRRTFSCLIRSFDAEAPSTRGSHGDEAQRTR